MSEQKPVEKIKYEFTREQVATLWEMVDVCLKAGGLRNLIKMHEIAIALQKSSVEALMGGLKKNVPTAPVEPAK